MTLGIGSPALASGTFYVDNSSLACSDAGPGTEASPYCTISAALAAHGGPGTTILVKAGTYREQITVPTSGAPGDPLTIKALGTVTVDGAEDFNSTAQWALLSGNVWLAAGVTWSPGQVFVDDVRLASSTDDPAALPASSYRHVPGAGLYVNAGGGNPGARRTAVGRRSFGFLLDGRSWVVVEGFAITRASEKGVFLNASENATVRGNAVTYCKSSGISAFGCTEILIQSNQVHHNTHHGISLRLGTIASTVEDNVSFRNIGGSNPGEEFATGIYLAGSPANLIRRNRLHENDDSGLEIQTGSDQCVSIQNVSWNNGDHGFQHLYASGTANVGNVAFGNHTDGFSIEGNAVGTSLFNCIATDNGLPVNRFDLLVDPTSTAGFASNYNIFWKSGAQNPVSYNGVQYATVAAYGAVSGQDAQSIQANPRFTNPAGGDFQLLAGSPAIDSGNSSVLNWPATDAKGNARVDDPATANTGTGPILHADRGALEHGSTLLAVDDPGPGAALSVTGAFPNPSHGNVVFMLELPRAASVEWDIHDLQGRRVASGVQSFGPGRVALDWSGHDPAGRAGRGGIYFARFQVEQRGYTRRFVVLP